MQPLTYALSEGFKLSWKVGLVGGAIGSLLGYVVSQDMKGKISSYNKNLLDEIYNVFANAVFLTAGMAGSMGGTGAGFIFGAISGSLDWATKGPQELSSPCNLSLGLGVAFTTSTALIIIGMMSRRN